MTCFVRVLSTDLAAWNIEDEKVPFWTKRYMTLDFPDTHTAAHVLNDRQVV